MLGPKRADAQRRLTRLSFKGFEVLRLGELQTAIFLLPPVARLLRCAMSPREVGDLCAGSSIL